MERLRQRLSLAEKALATLDEVESLALPAAVERDITIMRFIYTFEACWRALQRYLNLVEGVEAETPKACMRGPAMPASSPTRRPKPRSSWSTIET